MWPCYFIYDKNISRGPGGLMLNIIIICIVLYLLIIFHLMFWNPELRWDWKKINMSNMKFPSSFYWGTATASHQVEGNCNNNNCYNW